MEGEEPTLPVGGRCVPFSSRPEHRRLDRSAIPGGRAADRTRRTSAARAPARRQVRRYRRRGRRRRSESPPSAPRASRGRCLTVASAHVDTITPPSALSSAINPNSTRSVQDQPHSPRAERDPHRDLPSSHGRSRHQRRRDVGAAQEEDHGGDGSQTPKDGREPGLLVERHDPVTSRNHAEARVHQERRQRQIAIGDGQRFEPPSPQTLHDALHRNARGEPPNGPPVARRRYEPPVGGPSSRAATEQA